MQTQSCISLYTLSNPDNLQINVWTVNKKCGVPCGYIGADHRN